MIKWPWIKQDWIEPTYRFIATHMCRLVYDITYIDFDKIPMEGGGIIIANHVSYADGLVIQTGVNKRPIRFLIDKFIYDVPLVHYFMVHNRAIPIKAKKEYVEAAIETMSVGLSQGDLIGIFPEGQLTYTGHLGRFKPGIEWLIEKNPTTVYPIAIKGLWGSIFSRKYRKSSFRFVPKTFRRKIIAKCGDPIPPEKVEINYLQKVIMDLKHSI